MRKMVLSVIAIQDYSCGPYNYYVETPEGEVMYFLTKDKAKDFIEFYKSYTEKKLNKL